MVVQCGNRTQSAAVGSSVEIQSRRALHLLCQYEYISKREGSAGKRLEYKDTRKTTNLLFLSIQHSLLTRGRLLRAIGGF